ncbi:hypothetical protein ACRYCC_21910 [Actinomadura scrupuli]|uniref:hypothetical protein n=1 Tax=Actinomadura scrupuli TaxID=559629 RepID=UPI003D969DF1
MRKYSASVFVVAAATAGSLAVASPAFADTWSVSGGGTISGSLKPGVNAVLRDTTTGQNITCGVASAGGTIADGTGLSGTGIAGITSATFGTSSNKCSGPFFSSFTSALKPGTTWSLNAVSYSGGVTSGTITGIDALVTGSSLFGSCNAEVTGEVDSVTYDNATGELKIAVDATPSLTIGNVSGSGCAGLIRNGDKATLAATFVVTPTVQITSP